MADTALVKAEQPSGFGEMIQQDPQPQGLTPTVVPLDRETLTFYGNMITAAGLVPSGGNVTPEIAKYRVMAKVVAGVSYGFDPVLSQKCFDVMFNQMTPNAFCMEILFKDSGEFDWRSEYLDETGCKLNILQRFNGEFDAIRGRYTGGEWRKIGTVEFTIEMAKKAGLFDKKDSLWPKYPADLSFARCVTRAVKRFNPGCMRPRMLLGNYFAKQPTTVHEPLPTEPVRPLIDAAPESVPAEVWVDPIDVETDEINAVVEELAEPEPIAAAAIDTDEDKAASKIADLQTAAVDLYRDLDAAAKTKANEFLGVRSIAELSADELTEFLSKFEK